MRQCDRHAIARKRARRHGAHDQIEREAVSEAERTSDDESLQNQAEHHAYMRTFALLHGKNIEPGNRNHRLPNAVKNAQKRRHLKRNAGLRENRRSGEAHHKRGNARPHRKRTRLHRAATRKRDDERSDDDRSRLAREHEPELGDKAHALPHRPHGRQVSQRSGRLCQAEAHNGRSRFLFSLLFHNPSPYGTCLL